MCSIYIYDISSQRVNINFILLLIAFVVVIIQTLINQNARYEHKENDLLFSCSVRVRILILINLINCNWVVTRWQYAFTHKQYIEQHK